MLNDINPWSAQFNYLYYIFYRILFVLSFVYFCTRQLWSRVIKRQFQSEYISTVWLTLESSAYAIFQEGRKGTRIFWRDDTRTQAKREWRTYTRKLPWARNEICQEMRFSARAVMYAARINGGSQWKTSSLWLPTIKIEREKDKRKGDGAYLFRDGGGDFWISS